MRLSNFVLTALLMASAPFCVGNALADRTNESTDRCTHTGTEWVNPRVVDVGAAQCPRASFDLVIGSDVQGGSLSIKYDGCPTYLTIAPGHMKKVPKAHYLTRGPQKVFWKTQIYVADCGGFWSGPTCAADGPPTHTLNYEEHYIEAACDVVTGADSPVTPVGDITEPSDGRG